MCHYRPTSVSIARTWDSSSVRSLSSMRGRRYTTSKGALPLPILVSRSIALWWKSSASLAHAYAIPPSKTGRTTYRGLVKVTNGAKGARSKVVCDALILDKESRSDTYPVMEVDEAEVSIAHEATVSRIQDEQLFYLMSRGLSETEASTMIVNGFIEPLVKELPMEYAVEMNRLIELQMEGSVG